MQHIWSSLTHPPHSLRREGKTVCKMLPLGAATVQSCKAASSQRAAFHLPTEATLPRTAQPICLLCDVNGSLQYQWNQTCSSREKFHGISFAGRGRERGVERIHPDSTVLTEERKNNQHSSQWSLVIPVVHRGTGHLKTFADSGHDLKLKLSFHLGNKMWYWFSDWAGDKEISWEGRKLPWVSLSLKDLNVLSHNNEKIHNRRMYAPKYILGKAKYWALYKAWLKRQRFLHKTNTAKWNIRRL